MRRTPRHLLLLCAAVPLVGGCGGARQDESEPSGDFPVAVTAARFPAQQVLAEQARLTITVRNAGSKTIPDIAVTITNPDSGTAAQAFAAYNAQPGLASGSRPVWIVDDGPTAGESSATNTWALGRLAAGRSATFTWKVTAVKAGRYAVHYRVNAGLNGKAKAVLSGGGAPEGEFAVTIDGRAEQAIVTDSGKVKSLGPRK